MSFRISQSPGRHLEIAYNSKTIRMIKDMVKETVQIRFDVTKLSKIKAVQIQ